MPLTPHHNRSIDIVMVPVDAVTSKDTLSHHIRDLYTFGSLPVVDEETNLVGSVLAEQTLNDAISTTSPLGSELDQATTSLNAFSIKDTATLGTLIEKIKTSEHPLTNLLMIPIVEPSGKYSGFCVSRAKLGDLIAGTLRPPKLGGLATPLGVYITSGYHIAGSKLPGLIATGVLFGLFMTLVEALYPLAAVALITAFPPLSTYGNEGLWGGIQNRYFLMDLLIGIRFTPISRLHVAEHMTINAIESGSEINLDKVRDFPKEHIRCGTNLMVIFLGIQIGALSLHAMQSTLSITGEMLYIVFWIVLIKVFGKPVGIWLQKHFTTTVPNDAQLESGLKAGREIIQKFKDDPHPKPSVWQRVWGMGFLQVLSAYALTHWLGSMLIEFLWNFTAGERLEIIY